MCVARAGGRMAVCTRGNGVVPAGIQRVATRDAPRREPAAAQWTVRADGVHRIVRAAGIETAARPEQWTDQDLVAADEDDDAGCEGVTEEDGIRVHRRSRLRSEERRVGKEGFRTVKSW